MTPEQLAEVRMRMPDVVRQDMSQTEWDRANLLDEVDRLTAERDANWAAYLHRTEEVSQATEAYLFVVAERDKARSQLAQVRAILNVDNAAPQVESVVALGLHLPKVSELFAALWRAVG